jgi:hypothetical protein
MRRIGLSVTQSLQIILRGFEVGPEPESGLNFRARFALPAFSLEHQP